MMKQFDNVLLSEFNLNFSSFCFQQKIPEVESVKVYEKDT